MKERVVSLSDRGRALEWLSLGFGLWLIAGLVFALNALDVRSRIDADGVVTVSGVLAMASSIAHLFAGAAIGFGAYIMLHAGSPLWSRCTLAALVVAVVERSILVWLPLLDLQSVWSIGAIAQLMLVGSAFLGIRQLASGEGRPVPLTLLGVLVGAEIARLLLLATYWLEGARMRHDAMLPSVRVALVGVASVVSMGIVVLLSFGRTTNDGFPAFATSTANYRALCNDVYLALFARSVVYALATVVISIVYLGVRR